MIKEQYSILSTLFLLLCKRKLLLHFSARLLVCHKCPPVPCVMRVWVFTNAPPSQIRQVKGFPRNWGLTWDWGRSQRVGTIINVPSLVLGWRHLQASPCLTWDWRTFTETVYKARDRKVSLRLITVSKACINSFVWFFHLCVPNRAREKFSKFYSC